MAYIVVFLGGGLGAALRHGINLAVARMLGGGFPYATFFINVTGSFVMGLVAAWFAYETFFTKDQLWITITAVGVVYCVWNFFLRYPQDPPVTPPGTTGGGTGPAAPSGSPDSNSGDAPKA